MTEDGLQTHVIEGPSRAIAQAAAAANTAGEIALRVQMRLRSPIVVWPGDKTMDAPLSWAAVEQARYRGDADPVAAMHNLGLAWYQTPTQRCCKASVIDIVVAREAVSGAPALYPSPYPYIKFQNSRTYSRAWSSGLVKKRPPRFDGQRGSTVAGMFVEHVLLADELVAYVVADGLAGLDRLLELLPYLTHIGKLRRLDLGALASIHLTVDKAAHQRWADRPLPIDAQPDEVGRDGAAGADQAHAVQAIAALDGPNYDRRRHVPTLRFLNE